MHDLKVELEPHLTAMPLKLDLHVLPPNQERNGST